MSVNPYQSPTQASEPLQRPDLHAESGGSIFAAAAVLIAAALVMAATIPGRTQGLSLITTRLLTDFPGLTDRGFANINFWATLLGGLFCLPCGWLLDRVPPRYLVLFTMLALAATTLAMTTTQSIAWLAVHITLTRGFGQSMLSVISITLMAKWFRRDSSLAMGSYAIVMTLLMVIGFGLLQSKIVALGWRDSWASLGWALLIISPLACGLAWRVPAGNKTNESSQNTFGSATLSTALGTGCFWVFAISISMFGLVSSGVSLYQGQILASLGLPEEVFHQCQLIGLGVGLLANFITGWLARKGSLSLLLGIAMTVFAASLITLPLLRTPGQAYAQAVVHALAGGAIVVLFYMIWGHAFGPQHVGKIQGAAQWLTVVASAAGPWVIIEGRNYLGSYQAIIWLLAALVGFVAVFAFFTHVPVATLGHWRKLDSPPRPATDYQLSQETA